MFDVIFFCLCWVLTFLYFKPCTNLNDLTHNIALIYIKVRVINFSQFIGEHNSRASTFRHEAYYFHRSNRVFLLCRNTVRNHLKQVRIENFNSTYVYVTILVHELFKNISWPCRSKDFKMSYTRLVLFGIVTIAVIVAIVTFIFGSIKLLFCLQDITFFIVEAYMQLLGSAPVSYLNNGATSYFLLINTILDDRVKELFNTFRVSQRNSKVSCFWV